MPKTSPLLLLQDYPVITQRAVNWRDVDAALHVNNCVYLAWAESGRLDYFSKYFAATGKSHLPGTGPVLATIHCRFLKALSYPDVAWVGTRMHEIGAYRYKLEAAIVSQEQEKVVAKLLAKMVLFDFEKGEKIPLPAEFEADILTFETQAKIALHTDGA